MAALFVWLWIVGGAPAVILGEVVRADNPRIARAGRIGFALLLAVDLLIAAVIFAAGQDAASSPMSRSLWWFTVIAAGIPLALVSGYAVRRGYPGKRRIALVVSTLTTAALYVAFPLGFIPRDNPRLTGLGLWEHDHRVLGIGILLIPTLILLVNELGWKQEEAPVSDPDHVSLRTRIGRVPRRHLIGVGAFLLLLIWMSGTNGAGLLLGFGVFFAGSAVFLWLWHRTTMRNVRRDLKPPEQP